jgi:hypothetical protein
MKRLKPTELRKDIIAVRNFSDAPELIGEIAEEYGMNRGQFMRACMASVINDHRRALAKALAKQPPANDNQENQNDRSKPTLVHDAER